jgi:aminopeptidase N
MVTMTDGSMRVGLIAMLMAMAMPLAGQVVPETGVSHALAMARAARLSGLRYDLRFALEAHAAKIKATETVTFTDSGSGDLPVDFRDGELESATLNGHPLPIKTVNDHLMLPAAALQPGANELKIAYTANVAAAGKAITRYQDRDDGNEYLYTLFVPMDASMAFPCFDQPDLKAKFTLEVSAPRAWRVIGNTDAKSVTALGTNKQWTFPETRPISTYLFAFAAGPFESVHPTAGQPKVFVRKSQVARAQAEVPQVQAMAARGIAYLSNYFAQPFPFPKYDLVLIPGFPFGGMEHAGATFLNEDGVLFRTAPTESDRFRRNILVLHETTHQWFGDLVTMRWFDDLWLKEGFAQYVAYKALAELEPQQLPWKHFYEEIKPQAYGIDETQGTTPIFQNIANLKDAKSAYGAIVYQKAPAVLKQLEFRIGGTAFRDGLRSYLKDHAYGNAQWSDLIGAFKAHGATGLDGWADAWIKRRGMPQVDVTWACAAGKMTELTLRQRDVLNTDAVWPISNRITLDYGGKAGVANRALRADWSGRSFEVKTALGQPCPAFVFSNQDDEAYGRFLLDEKSDPGATRALLQTPAAKQDLLLRTMLWGALWDNVHVAQSAPHGYVELALKSLPAEEDESLARIQGGRVATAFHAYMTEPARAALVPRMEVIAEDRMLHAPTLGLRIVSFHTFTNIAETPKALGEIKGFLAGSLRVPGLTLRSLDRWNMVGHLVSMNDSQAAEVLAAEKVRDTSGEGQKYAYAVEAGAPDAKAKAKYFEDYLRVPGQETARGAVRQEDWITQSLRPFNSWNQTALTEPYLTRALDALPEIKLHRKIFFLGAWLGAFIDGQNSAAAQSTVHEWLTRKEMDPDLRLKVLEVSDELDRTVMIRQRFPQ